MFTFAKKHCEEKIRQEMPSEMRGPIRQKWSGPCACGSASENFIEINRKHDDRCSNKNYNEGLCGLIQGDLR